MSFLTHIIASITDGEKLNKTSVENIGKHYGIKDQNHVKELTELAIVTISRDLAHQPHKTTYEKYEDIVELYEKQVSLNHRTSHSILLQQYSTPAPVGYLMGLFCGIDKPNITGLEPSAGNGLLTIAGNPKNFTVNEIDDVRLDNLKTQGFLKVSSQDGQKPFPLNYHHHFDAVITNPPFGKLENAEMVADKYKIKGLEHIMAINAIDCMKDTGKAAIIIGGHLEFNEDGMIPSGKNRIFFAYLYKFYNVSDVINIDGSLYKKQGTSFNVRVILINGRKTIPAGLPPFSKDIDSQPVADFETLFQRFSLSDTTITEGTPSKPMHPHPTDMPKVNNLKLLKLKANALLLIENGTTDLGSVPEIELSYSENNSYKSEQITSSQKAADLFRNFYKDEKIQLQEMFSIALLNKARKVLGVHRLSNGSKAGTVVDPSYILAMASKTNASFVMICHNHPSGNLIPSSADRSITKQVGKALDLIGVSLSDHIILTKTDYISFADQNESLNGIYKDTANKEFYMDGLDGLGMAYESASQSCHSLVLDTPDSMGNEIKAALKQLMNDVGNVDDYVAGKLNFTNLELCKYLAAEQVDAVALAIYNIEKNKQGIIIADQTGIGKGRQAAAIIRYAIISGVKPIFMTEKPNLFSDIYRDLEAIGSAHYQPFIMNGKESKTLVKDSAGNVVYEPLDKSDQDKVIKSGKLPNEFDYIMLTYSQISGGEFSKSGVWTKESPKQSFLLQMATDSILILDESHNASGESNTGKVLQTIVSVTRGVTFLSATFAKRPDNMPLYAMKTAMEEANMSKEDLVAAIEKGGVALQEVLSAQLVSAGQLIRRERTFEGIEVNYITLFEKSKEHKAVYDNITKLMRDIIWFQGEFINPEIAELNKIAEASYTNVETRKGNSAIGVDNTPYFSKVFNQINQMLFAIKADSVADRAIMRLQQGKKPVIAFSSTMGSFLASMEDNDGLPVHDGSMINADFSYTLTKALTGILRYTEKDETGTPTYKTFDIAQFSEDAQIIYNKIAKDISKLTSGLYLSPIDVIKEKIEAAGYRVGEVTGRSLALQYVPSKNNGGMKAMVKTRKKENVADAFRKFNNNEIDVLLINQSGATGASAHAIITPLVSKEEVKQRVMIVLQAELDINTEVQKRGRINRTGQILKPIYDYLISDIPAEKRLMMMLQKKLKSLDANTTSNQKNSEALLKSDDFLNKYGDKIVMDYLRENLELNEQLDDPLKLTESQADSDKTPTVMENAASKVAGRVAVLSTTEQETFYTEVLERYNDYITELKQKGLYDLEVEILNLQAETISKQIYKAGKGGKTSFGSNTYIEQCEVNIIKKPYTSIEVSNLVTKALDAKNYKDLKDLQITQVEKYFKDKIGVEADDIEDTYTNLIKNIVNEPKYKKLDSKDERQDYILYRTKILNEAKELKLEKNHDLLNYKSKSIVKFISYFTVGSWLTYPNDNETMATEPTYAVSFGISINYSQKNPFAPSAIKLNLAISSGLKYVTIPLSKNIELNAIIGETGNFNESNWITEKDLHDRWDFLIKESSVDRGKQFIVTGNVLQAFGDEKLTGGKLVQFTTIEGTQRKGILLPIHWQYGDKGENIVPLIPIYKARKAIKAIAEGAMIHSGAGQGQGVSISKQYYGGFKLFVPKSRKSGGDIYLDKKILNFVDDNNFNSVGTTMVAVISEQNLFPVLEILQNVHNVSVRLQPWQMDLIKDEIEGDNFSDVISEIIPIPEKAEDTTSAPKGNDSEITPDPDKIRRLKLLKLKAKALLLLELEAA